MLSSFIRRVYFWDDLVDILARYPLSVFARFLRIFLFLLFWAIFAFYGYPSMKMILSKQDIYLSQSRLIKRGNQLALEYRKNLSEYRRIRDSVHRLMDVETPYVNSKVFDTLLSLFHEIGVYDIYLNIGRAKESQVEDVKLLLVPVGIKAYVDYALLPKFFKVLNQHLVYKIERLKISWSPEQEKEKVLLDIQVVFRYKYS